MLAFDLSGTEADAARGLGIARPARPSACRGSATAQVIQPSKLKTIATLTSVFSSPKSMPRSDLRTRAAAVIETTSLIAIRIAVVLIWTPTLTVAWTQAADTLAPADWPNVAPSPATVSPTPRRASRDTEKIVCTGQPAPDRRLAPFQLGGGLGVCFALEIAEQDRQPVFLG